MIERVKFILKALPHSSNPLIIGWYLALAPVVFLLNNHQVPFKIFLTGCVLISLWLWHVEGFRKPSLLFLLALVNVAFSLVVVFGSHAYACPFPKLPEMARYSYKIFFVIGFAALTYWAVVNQVIKPFLGSLKICAVIGTLLSLSSYAPGARLEAYGLASHPILGASIYGTIGVLAFYDALHINQQGPYIKNLTVFILCSLMVVLTLSRGPILAYVLTILIAAVYLVYRENKENWSRLLFLVSTLFGIYVFSQVLIYFFVPSLRDLLIGQGTWWEALGKVLVPIRSLQNSNSYRLHIWGEILKHMKGHLLFGFGYVEVLSIEVPEINLTINHPHSLYVSKLYREGIAGFAILFGFLMVMARKIIHCSKGHSSMGAIASLLCIHALLSCASDTSSLWDGKNMEMILFFWFPIAFLSGVEAASPSSSRP